MGIDWNLHLPLFCLCDYATRIWPGASFNKLSMVLEEHFSMMDAIAPSRFELQRIAV